MAKTVGTHTNLMLQARRMQGQIKSLQENLETAEFEGGAGGGLVKIVVDGRQKVKKVEIAADAFNPDDPGELSDLVMAAINMAITASQEASQREMRKITGGISLPGLY